MSRIPVAPLRVYAAPLRPQFSSKKIIEIHDAFGRVVVSWSGFDGTDFSYTQSLKIAKRMVKALNSGMLKP